jgi:hypothetical protein
LLFGALPRLQKRPRVRDAVLLGLGLAILANSRPYEGLVASIPVAAALLWRPSRRVLVPIAIVVSITGAATAYYCWRTTDQPFRMAYQLGRETYAMAPVFLWEQPRPEPIYRHAVMRQFYTEWEPNFQNAIGQNTLSGWLNAAVGRSEVQWGFYLGWALSVPLLMLPWTLRDRRMRFWLFACPVFLLGLALERYTQPHYLAPFVGVLMVLLLQGMRICGHRVAEGTWWEWWCWLAYAASSNRWFRRRCPIRTPVICGGRGSCGNWKARPGSTW